MRVLKERQPGATGFSNWLSGSVAILKDAFTLIKHIALIAFVIWLAVIAYTDRVRVSKAFSNLFIQLGEVSFEYVELFGVIKLHMKDTAQEVASVQKCAGSASKGQGSDQG